MTKVEMKEWEKARNSLYDSLPTWGFLKEQIYGVNVMS